MENETWWDNNTVIRSYSKCVVLGSYFNASIFVFAQYVPFVAIILVIIFKFWFYITTQCVVHIEREIHRIKLAFFKFCIHFLFWFFTNEKKNTLRAENLLNLFRLCLYKMQKIFFFIFTFGLLAIYLIKKFHFTTTCFMYNLSENLSLFFIFLEWNFIIQKNKGQLYDIKYLFFSWYQLTALRSLNFF